jgi:hypothetical protein
MKYQSFTTGSSNHIRCIIVQILIMKCVVDGRRAMLRNDAVIVRISSSRDDLVRITEDSRNLAAPIKKMLGSCGG